MKILKFVVKDSTFFTYENSVYKQVDGCPMGSNLSPILASIILNNLLDKTFEKLKIKPKLVVKYVDDLLLVLPNRKINSVLNEMNNYHTNIKFTVEEEKDNKLPYLDLLLIRIDDGTIKYQWYNKPTSSNKILNFKSNHPYKQKENTAYNLIIRSIKLSSPEYQNFSLETAKKHLLENGYPYKIIRKLINKANNIQNNININNQPSTNSPNYYRSIKYINGLSDTIVQTIKPKLNNVKITFDPVNKIDSVLVKSLKQKIDINEKSNVIYEIPCADISNNRPCNLSYVGQTKNKLKYRIKQHI